MDIDQGDDDDEEEEEEAPAAGRESDMNEGMMLDDGLGNLALES
jgi:hypothetical protein